MPRYEVYVTIEIDGKDEYDVRDAIVFGARTALEDSPYEQIQKIDIVSVDRIVER